MYIYIAAAVVVLVLLIVVYYFAFAESKWKDLKKRNAGESDDAWSKRIFGALRMNPSQGTEQAQINLNYLLANKNVISKNDAIEFVNAVKHWYPAQLEKSGYAKDGVISGF